MGRRKKNDVEVAVRFDDIIKILGWKRRKYFDRRKELEDAGVVFKQFSGCPHKRRLIMAFPSRVRAWMALKAAKGEPL